MPALGSVQEGLDAGLAGLVAAGELGLQGVDAVEQRPAPLGDLVLQLGEPGADGDEIVWRPSQDAQRLLDQLRR